MSEPNITIIDEQFDVNFIPMDIDNVAEKKFVQGEYNEGLKVGSYYAAIATCMFNTGMTSEDVKDILCEIIKNEQVEN